MTSAEAKKLSLRTRAVHAGRKIDPSTGAVAPPIQLSTTFERDSDGTYPKGFIYTTFGNPNRDDLETAIAALEGGAGAVALSSGMAATASVLSGLNSGDQVIGSYDIFQGTARLINDQVRRWGIGLDVVDIYDVEAVARAIGPATRMIWVDSPSNPLLRVPDIAALADLARRHGVYLVVDTTFATFVLQSVIELGADAAIYGATKFVGGHSDVVNGLAVFRERGELYDRARTFQINVGAVPSPFDCWLTHRGLRTLPLRMRAQSETALAVAQMLAAHPGVQKVLYPGIAGSQDYDVAVRQMHGGFGGVLSLIVHGGQSAAVRVVAAAKLFTRASSLGGVESLIEHRASSPIQTHGQGVGFALPQDLIRLSIGLEDADDLIADLRQALETASAGA